MKFFLLLIATIGVLFASDSVLGTIKNVQCVNCTPGFINLAVHDEIENKDYSIYLTESTYNKILTPLADKVIYTKDQICFYWLETPKVLTKTKENAASSKKRKTPESKAPVINEPATEPPTESACIPYVLSPETKSN